MLETRKLNDKVVAVSFNGPTEILLRNSGRENFGKEEKLLGFEGGNLVIDLEVLEKYGLGVEFTDRRNGKERPYTDCIPVYLR